MKKYFGVIIALVAILAMGSASAIVFQTGSLSNKSPLLGTLGGGCGGHGCHNNSNLTEITGLLEYDGETFTMDDTILCFGCYSWLNTTVSPYDFDGDGEIETLWDEIQGMVGTTITVSGYMNCHHSRLMVYYINGIEYRECHHGIMHSNIG